MFHAATRPGSRKSGLDWLNSFIADVETAFGPFVALWLSSQGWSQGTIGIMHDRAGLCAQALGFAWGFAAIGALTTAAIAAAWLLMPETVSAAQD